MYDSDGSWGMKGLGFDPLIIGAITSPISSAIDLWGDIEKAKAQAKLTKAEVAMQKKALEAQKALEAGKSTRTTAYVIGGIAVVVAGIFLLSALRKK